MKITVEVLPESDHMRAIYALMDRTVFKEIDRVVTGGHMSAVMLVITFQGNGQEFNMLKNSIYVEMPFNDKSKMYYSLTCLNGKNAKSVEEFIDYLNQQVMTKPEIKYFN